MRKSIKNYTSNVPVQKTIGKIQEILSAKGAEKIMIDYANGKPVGLMFMLKTTKGQIPIKLPARIENVQQVFYNNKKPRYKWEKPVPLTESEKQQAERTAWKNIEDWIDAQLALIETEMVKIEEVFLPYVIMGNNQTLFDQFNSGTLKLGSGER